MEMGTQQSPYSNQSIVQFNWNTQRYVAVNNSGASILMVMSGTMDNEKIMENVIKNGAKVNYINKDNVSAIMIAAKISKNPEILKLLIKYGADKKAKDSLGISVYEILKSNPNLKNNKELLNLLK
jgi:ankyrin repeat protein